MWQKWECWYVWIYSAAGICADIGDSDGKNGQEEKMQEGL